MLIADKKSKKNIHPQLRIVQKHPELRLDVW